MPGCPRCGAENPERARFCLECGLALDTLPQEPRESRRTVTVLFSDLVGSTALGELLDPETLRAVMASYFSEMQTVIERHGGTVEKFIGDAIMAVFGLPVLHEDDALRAVRAAAEMRDALVALNVRLQAERGVTIAVRTGVHTGEVVAGDATARQTLVTGDAVNTAARLEQAAAAGEILMGRPTWLLVRDSVVTDAVAPISAKGKAAPVDALRLVSVTPALLPVARAPGMPLVGRVAELERMEDVFEDVVRFRTPMLLTVIGPAGVGKSRLVNEFVAWASPRAAVVRGRCLPYGEGITYWPVRELLHAAADIADSDPPDAGTQKLALLLGDVPDGPLLASRLASAIGLSADPVPRDEIFWAVRRTLEHLASERPLVVVIEDIHWAETTLLELVEHVVEVSRDVPLMIVCPSRPELLEAAQGWKATGPHLGSIVLEGLTAEAAGELMDSMLEGTSIAQELRDRILATAEGNPLFVEEMVRMLLEDRDPDRELGDGHQDAAEHKETGLVEVPPTIQALLAARLDRLPRRERSVAQRASVVGRTFEEETIVALTAPEAKPDVRESLLGLVRKELVSPEMTDLSVADAYKFRHILIRDAAYDALPKSERADLHERFADWLEQASGGRVAEYQEILGYHLGQAYHYRTELREAGPRTEEVGRRGATYLSAAGKAARDRADSAAAVRLYEAADALPLPDRGARATLMLELGIALYDLSRLVDAAARAEVALALATETGDRSIAARARLLRLDVSLADGTFVTSDPRIGPELEAAIRDAEASGDQRAIAEAWSSLGGQSWTEARTEDYANELRVARDHARAAGDLRFELEIELNLLVGTFAGPTPASDVAALAEAMVERAAAFPSIRAEAQQLQAISEAMLGRMDDGRTHADESIAILVDLAQFGSVVNGRTYRAWIDRLAGDLPAADAQLRQALEEAAAIGDRSLESFVSCRLAETLVEEGRYEQAVPLLAVAARNPIGPTETRIAGAQARIKAARGDRSAVGDIEVLVESVGHRWPNVRCDALIDAAGVMASLGDRAAAAAYAREALGLAEAKENVARAARIRVLLETLDLDVDAG